MAVVLVRAVLQRPPVQRMRALAYQKMLECEIKSVTLFPRSYNIHRERIPCESA